MANATGKKSRQENSRAEKERRSTEEKTQGCTGYHFCNHRPATGKEDERAVGTEDK